MAFILRLFGAYVMVSGALHSATGAIVVYTVEQPVNNRIIVGPDTEGVRRGAGLDAALLEGFVHEDAGGDADVERRHFADDG